MDGWMDGWMDGCMDGSMDNWIDDWLEGWCQPYFLTPSMKAGGTFARLVPGSDVQHEAVFAVSPSCPPSDNRASTLFPNLIPILSPMSHP